MNLLALEFSSGKGSAALFLDGSPAAEHTWGPEERRHEHSLDIVARMVSEAGCRFEDLDLYATGRGPGNYSGMRIGLAMAQSLALPDRKPVFAVPSGEALAWQVRAEVPDLPIAVTGDARRGKVWLGVFLPEQNGLEQQGPWALHDPEAVRAAVPASAAWVTPEWPRLEPIIAKNGWEDFAWIKESRHPSATGVGERVLARHQAGVPSDPLTPLYLHRPVA
jgi:tRNA threonylcarbamoyladenosine biosynthesis protein TsaB